MDNRTRLLVLFVQIFVFQAGFGIVVPVLPLFAESFGIGAAGVGSVVAIYGLARVMTDLPAANLARILGHSRAMALGALLLAVGSALCGVAGSYPELLAYRFVTGAGAAITLVVGQAMAATQPEPFGRARSLAYYQGAFLAGAGIGPAIGGPMADAFGLAAPFFAYATLATVVAVMGFLVERHGARTGAPQVHAHPSLKNLRYRDLLSDTPFMLISMLTLLFYATRTGGMFALVPLFGAEDLALSASQIGYAMTISGVINMAVTFSAGSLAERFGQKRMLLPGSLLIAGAFVLFAGSGDWLAFMLAACLWGVGTGMTTPVAALYAANRVGSGDVTGALALYRMVADFGYVLGPTLLGLVAAGFGIPTAFIVIAAAIALVLGAFNVATPPEPRPQRTPRQ